MINRVYILGTPYEVKMVNSESMFNKENAGECDRYDKHIYINKDVFEGEDVTDNKTEYLCQIIRHEAIHAALHEAGLDCYSEDEVLVDALAVLIPKIEKAMVQTILAVKIKDIMEDYEDEEL